MKEAIISIGIFLGASISVSAQIDAIYKHDPKEIKIENSFDSKGAALIICDSTKNFFHKKYDSVYRLLRLERLRLQQLVYYNKIVIRNPKQLKFLKGWLNRALQ